MNKKMKLNPGLMPPAGYATPSVRVITVKMGHAILANSPTIYNTEVTETGEDQNVF